MSTRQASSSSSAMAAAVTISADELFSMRRMADAPVWTRSVAEEREADLRAQRQAASKERAGRWPNTLEGLRKRKDQARLDRIAEAEAAGRVQDGIEKAKRDAERQAVLDRASGFMEQQKEKMKVLANFRARSYDADILKQQGELKRESEEERRREEQEAHERMLHELAQAQAEEDGKMGAMRAKARALQAERTATLKEVIARRIKEMEETEEAGRRSLEEIAARAQDQYNAAVAKRELGAAKNREFQEENRRLKAVREEMKKGEAEALAWVAAQAEAKEAKDKLIKSIIQRGRDEAEKKARQITEIMERDLLGRKNTEDARLEGEVAAADAKDRERQAQRERLGREMRESIAADIKRVKERTLKAIREQMAEDKREDELFRAKLAGMEAEEAAARVKAREFATRYKLDAMNSVAERQRAAAELRAKTIAAELEEMAKIARGDDDAGFRTACDDIRQEERAKGHSLQPFERLVYKTLNTSLAK